MPIRATETGETGDTIRDVDLWDVIAAGLERDGDFAVQEHLAAGRAVYSWEEGTPAGLAIKRYPDGRRELVRHHRDGDEVIQHLNGTS